MQHSNPRAPAKPPHYLITRFAIRPEGELGDFVRLDSTVPAVFEDPKWLADRLRIFAQWCVPSVEAQKTKFDGWLILVSADLPDHFLRLLVETSPSWAEIVVVSANESFTDCLAGYFRSVGSHFLTTRLDADDALAKGFKETVDRNARPGRVLNLSHGYQYFTLSKVLVHRRIRSNPFISHWTVIGENIFDFGIHSQVAERVLVDEIWTVKPMFLKIAHESNTAHNGFGGLPVLTAPFAAKSFGLSQSFGQPRLSALTLMLRAWAGSNYDKFKSRTAVLFGRTPRPRRLGS